MHKTITISLSEEDFGTLSKAAAVKGVSAEEWVLDAVHLLLSPHSIDSEELADGYLADIKLSI